MSISRLDSENRLNAAHYFFQMANVEASRGNVPEFTWNIQATVIFATDAVEVLRYDFAERYRLADKQARVGLSTLMARAKVKDLSFYDDLEIKCKDTIFEFANTERNLIVHPGEPDKGPRVIRINVGGRPRTSIQAQFRGRPRQADEDCFDLLSWVQQVIAKSKQDYSLLRS